MYCYWTTVPLGWLSKSLVRGNPPNGHCFRCFTWLSTLCKKRTDKSKNLWRFNIMLISARGIFYNLKSCLVSLNPFQMDSHDSWDKEANFQHCLLALYDLDPPGPCNHSAFTVEDPSEPTAPSLLPECLPLTAILLKYFLFPSWLAGLYSNVRSPAVNFFFPWETFPDPREVSSSVTKIMMCPGLSGQFRFSPVVWLLPPVIHWFQASGPPHLKFTLHTVLMLHQNYTSYWKYMWFYF